MSNFTSMILFIPAAEVLEARINEINAYKLENGKSFSMVDVNKSPFPDIFPRFILCGAYKNFDLPRFITYLSEKVQWEEPHLVKLLVQDDYSDNIDLYELNKF